MMYIHWIIFVFFLYNVNGGKKYIIKTAGEDDGVRQTWKKNIALRAPEVGNQNYSVYFIDEIRKQNRAQDLHLRKQDRAQDFYFRKQDRSHHNITVSITQLLKNFWRWRLRQSPECATMEGSKEYNDILETFTEKRFEQDLKYCRKFNTKAKSLLKRTTDPNEILNLEFFIAETSTFIDGYRFKGFYFPINYNKGVHLDFQRLAKAANPSNLKDYVNILSRYRKFPTQAGQMIDMMRLGVKKQLTNHNVSMEGVLEQCKEHGSALVEDTVFYKPFMNAENIDNTEKKRLKDAAKDAIKNFVQAGFMNLADFFESEYLPACRPDIAASSLPVLGTEFYKACLKFHTSTELTARQIHNKGVQEVARIEGKMREVIKELGLNMSLNDFRENLRNDKTNYFKSKQELLDAFSSIINDRINPKLSRIFNFFPETKLEITEALNPEAPSAGYRSGKKGVWPGQVIINTFKFNSRLKYELVSLALHEANPGHHLQISYMRETEGMPRFRKASAGVVYSQPPSRFPMNTAFEEGWALYCETLGYDLGLYDDPLDKYGHLSMDIYRACRLVVDTGMHAMGWSKEQAVQYMMEHTSIRKEKILREVKRYVTRPGQAVAYKIGQQKIIELRRKAEQAMGEKFDIKQFHDVVLRAAGPLNILERQVDQWIKNN